MIHEELLAKIERHMFNGVAFGFINSGKEAFQALRAVVELCKQANETTGNLITTDVIIAAIEKELK